MPKNLPPLFFDTVVLSNFAFVEEGILFLKKRYQKRGKITLQVFQEITKATFVDYQQLKHLESQMVSKNGFQKISLNEKEQAEYLILLRHLGEGEASCLAAAMIQKGIVATDDRMARSSCKEKNVAVTGTIGILKAACLDGSINLETADHMLQQMIHNGFYSPINKISDICHL